MKIIFVSRRRHPVTYETLNPDVLEDKMKLMTLVSQLVYKPYNYIAHDVENSTILLLSSFCWKDSPILVVDNTSVSNTEVFPYLGNVCFVCHNADHEAQWNAYHNFIPDRYYCTMVADQVLMAGLDGIKFDLVSVAGRRIDEFDITKLEWNKDTRDQFHKATRDFLFTDEHIKYNAIDSYILPYIYEKQQHLAEANNQLFLINSLRSRIIKPLAEAERTGFVHNSEKWREITKKRIEEAKELSEQMDNYIAERKIHASIINPEVAKKLEQRSGRENRLRERLEKTRNKILELESTNKTHLKSYQTLKELYSELMNHLDTVVNQPTEKARINWGSSKQALEVFRRLGVKLPQKKDNTTHEMKAGVSKEARTNWMVENMDSEHYQFMELFDKYKRVSHNISAFGEKWIEKYVRSNGKAYTTFRQASTATLRLASGNADAGLFNLQQIPSRDGPEYRECFGTDPGRGIIVLDYVGCELVCMISLSKDLDLKRISELPDQHSYLGTKCWRAVYLDRYNRTKDQKWLELANSYEMNSSTPAKKKERTKFKESGAFPVV